MNQSGSRLSHACANLLARSSKKVREPESPSEPHIISALDFSARFAVSKFALRVLSMFEFSSRYDVFMSDEFINI
jgi:hypothetical protein